MSMKNSNDTIENRTHDLPDCNAVPQPTAPPGGPVAERMRREKEECTISFYIYGTRVSLTELQIQLLLPTTHANRTQL
jgi:hypothetical protein